LLRLERAIATPGALETEGMNCGFGPIGWSGGERVHGLLRWAFKAKVKL
jgi:hypothetical protein